MVTRFPHPLVLLFLGIAFAAFLTYIIPSGRFDRSTDPKSGRTVVVAGTFRHVAQTPVGPWQAVRCIQGGLVAAAPIIAFVFLVGGAFNVVEQTGALRKTVDWVIRKLKHNGTLAIIVCSALFAAGGFSFGMMEEVIAFVPMLIALTTRLGHPRLVAVAMSYGAAIVGAAMSPINPFCVGIAQSIAEIPHLSGGIFRVLFFIPALAMYVFLLCRYARLNHEKGASGKAVTESTDLQSFRLRGRDVAVVLLVVFTFGILVWGILKLDWHINELASLFLIMGIIAGLVGGLGTRLTSEAFVQGFARIAYAALLIGFARALLVVMEQGQIVDTIVINLFRPFAELPAVLAALGMLFAHAVIHVPIPSWSGQALTTLPILVPLSDLLGLSRQVTVLAYQYGSALPDLLVPTNGALLAMLALCEVSYGEWFRFAIKATGLLFVWSAVAVVVAIGIDLQ